MENTKKLLSYFAVAFLILAVLLQVTTATPGGSNKDQQAEIDALTASVNNLQTQVASLQTDNANLKSQVASLQTDDTNSKNQFTSLQNAVSNIKPGSQVVVVSGNINENQLSDLSMPGIINVPDGYTTDQCKLLLGVPNIYGATNDPSLVTFDPLDNEANNQGTISASIYASGDHKSFFVMPLYGKGWMIKQNTMGYIMVCVK